MQQWKNSRCAQFTLPSRICQPPAFPPSCQPAHSIATSVLPLFLLPATFDLFSCCQPLSFLSLAASRLPTTSLLPSAAESPLPLHSTFYFPSPFPSFSLSIFSISPFTPIELVVFGGIRPNISPFPSIADGNGNGRGGHHFDFVFSYPLSKSHGANGPTSSRAGADATFACATRPSFLPHFIHFASVSPTPPLICMHSNNTYSRRRARNCRHPTLHSRHQHPFRHLGLLPRLPRQRRTISPLLRSSCLVLCKNFIARGDKAIFDAVAKIYFRPSSHKTQLNPSPKIVRPTIIHLILLFPSTIHCHFHSFYIFLLFILCSLVVDGLFCLCFLLCPMILLSMFCPSLFQYFPSK